MQKLTLEHWDISRLVEYARNPRKNDEVVERMKASIKEFGFRIPIVAKSDGTVVDGHLRLKAGRALGLDTVPVVLADELTETQIKAFRLLANQSANWAEWDTELLTLEIDDLKLEGFDVELLGFDFELEELDTAVNFVDSFPEKYNITIECESLEEAEELNDRLGLNLDLTRQVLKRKFSECIL